MLCSWYSLGFLLVFVSLSSVLVKLLVDDAGAMLARPTKR